MKPHQHTKYLRQMFWKPNTIPWCNVLLVILLLQMAFPHDFSVRFRLDTQQAYTSHYVSASLPPIYIKANGDVYLGNSNPKIDMNNPEKAFKMIEDAAEDANRETDIKKVRLIVDKKVSFGRVQEVLRWLKKVDINVVGLVTNQKALMYDFFGQSIRN